MQCPSWKNFNPVTFRRLHERRHIVCRSDIWFHRHGVYDIREKTAEIHSHNVRTGFVRNPVFYFKPFIFVTYMHCHDRPALYFQGLMKKSQQSIKHLPAFVSAIHVCSIKGLYNIVFKIIILGRLG